MRAGDLLTLRVEKPAAGGRMIARAGGQVVLVAGALPGETVTARVERLGKGVAFADTRSVEIASADRRPPFVDPQCGGCLYAHIAYPRQLQLKAQVIADAFGRIGHITLDAAVPVAGSPEDGYRLRARLHVSGGRIGFYREGSHDLCDARATRQLTPATCDVIEALASRLRALGLHAVSEVEVSENVDASARAVHLEASSPVNPDAFSSLIGIGGVTGLSLGVLGQVGLVHGSPYVWDLLEWDGVRIELRRHVLAFFQGNRFLLRDLVGHVTAQVPQGATVVDLYAGVGLFAVAAAVARGARVTAVEGDRMAAQDLDANAVTAGGAVAAVHQAVEAFAASERPTPDVVIVDPPRTGLSREAQQGVVRLAARRVVYASCDVATLARDLRRLLDAGYRISSAAAFDLFPNTPHVETVVVLEAV